MLNKEEVVENKKRSYVKFLKSASEKSLTGSYPHQIYIEAYSGCNYSCDFCIVSLERVKGQSIPVDLFNKIIDEMHDKSQFIHYFLQGEPTLNKNLPELIDYGNDQHVDGMIITNGSRLTKEYSRELLKKGLEQIAFSTTGSNPEAYNKIHNSGDKYEKLLRNIIDFFINEHELNKIIRTRTVWVDSKDVRNGLLRYKQMFSLLPFDNVSVSELISWYGVNDEVTNFPQTKEEWKQLPTCTAPWRMMAINTNGDVRACFIDQQNRNIVGNVKEESVMEVWNGEKMQRFRKALIERDFEETDKFGPMCSQCNAMFRPDAMLKGNAWPYDFEKELKEFTDNDEDYFGYRTDPKKLEPKFEFILEHGDKWIEQMVRPQMSDIKFIEKFVSKELREQIPQSSYSSSTFKSNKKENLEMDNYKRSSKGEDGIYSDQWSEHHWKRMAEEYKIIKDAQSGKIN